MEQFSIDECFLDLTGTGAIYPDPVALAHTIRERIRKELGFTVNIGIAPNKLLAKMASDFEKPDRVHTLFPDEIPAKMWPLPVGELFTVGAATAEKLNRVEIATIGDLARTDLGRLQRLLGQKFGLQLHRYANGLDDSPVRAEPEEAKGYSNSVTLEEDVRTRDEARQILVLLADSVTARMRRDKKRAGCVAVTVRDTDFRTTATSAPLPPPPTSPPRSTPPAASSLTSCGTAGRCGCWASPSPGWSGRGRSSSPSFPRRPGTAAPAGPDGGRPAQKVRRRRHPPGGVGPLDADGGQKVPRPDGGRGRGGPLPYRSADPHR